MASDNRQLIIDPPYQAQFDVKVALDWIEELKRISADGYDISKYMLQAKKWLNQAKRLPQPKNKAKSSGR
jgi:hypothetical protein